MKLIPIGDASGIHGYAFWCPACQELHHYNVNPRNQQAVWNFNGDMGAPTFSPSLRYLSGNQCHLFVTAGRIAYCSDCLHAYAGKTVDLVELNPKTGRPFMVDENEKTSAAPPEAKRKSKAKAKPKAKPKAKQTHHAHAGEVGETGEHGHLGTNAADGRAKEK